MEGFGLPPWCQVLVGAGSQVLFISLFKNVCLFIGMMEMLDPG